MKVRNRMKFGDPEDITRPSEEGRSLRLPFAVVPLALAGTPREPEATTAHELIVRLSGNRAKAWGLDEPRERAVMLHAAVERLFEVARAQGCEDRLREGLDRTAIASVGPVVSEELKSHGLRTDIAPANDAYFMKPLISAMATALGKAPPRAAAARAS